MQDEMAVLRLERYTTQARSWISNSQKIADMQNHKEVDPVHLLVYALENLSNVVEVFKRAGVDTEELLKVSKASFKKLKKFDVESYLSQSFIDLLNRAEDKANKNKSEYIDLEHILNALSQEIRGVVGTIFTSFNITPGMFQPYMAVLYKEEGELLKSFTTDLVALVNEKNEVPVVGRNDEIRRLLEILKRKDKRHALIAGEAGIGKFSIIRGLASRINYNDVSSNLIGVRILELDINALFGGVSTKAEERIKELKLSIAKNKKNTILVIRNFDSLFSSHSMHNSGSLLKPLFDNKKVFFIATITLEGAKKVNNKDSNILHTFTAMTIDPPTEDDAIEVIRGLANTYELFHGIKIDESAIVSSVRLAKRYIQDKNLPDSAIGLLDETCARKYYALKGVPSELDRLVRRINLISEQQSILEENNDDLSVAAKIKLQDEKIFLVSEKDKKEADESDIVNEQNIAETLGDWTGIPVSKMLEAETEKLMKMENNLRERVVGQEEALISVSKSIRRSRVGLKDPNRPIGSFLFLGPSGVGKTELSKALAEFLFDDEQALIRMDMSEFMEKHMAQRLLGSPPGYVDSDQGGFLTEAVKRKPFSILLFDEVEKAHADVFNILLQLLDDGRLTDGRGKTIDFSNTIVIMTSNLGAQEILNLNENVNKDGNHHETMRKMLLEQLRKFFRPEFINRIDDIVIFKHLTHKCLHSIIDIQMKQLRKLLRLKQMEISLTEETKKELVNISFDPAFGARPLKRSIVRYIQNPLAEYMLQEQNLKDKIIEVDVKDKQFIFDYK